MKFFLLVMTLCFNIAAWAGQPIAGILKRDSDRTFFVSTDSQKAYEISKSSTSDSLISLSKLSSGDFIFGHGSFNEQANTLTVDSIDYVGLQRLLGTWVSSEGIFQFKNFTDAFFYTVSKKNAIKANLRYSTAPSQGDQWVLFLSNKAQTTLATIELNSLNATMRLYDSETGNILKTIRLTRWGQ